MKFNIFSKIHSALLTILVSAFFVVQVVAQSGTSSITGTVLDSNGQAVVGANVTLVSVAQKTRRTGITDGDGRYNFSALQPGTYNIEVEVQGFKKSITNDVQALVDKSTEIAVNLQVGEVSVVVNVDAGGIENLINKGDGSLGNNFVAQQIAQLPLEGRNVVNLLSLQPGVTPDGAVAGSRQDQANITLDGVDVNDQQTGLNIDQTEAFTSVLRVTPDSIGEFRVTTTNPDASKGRSAGAQVSLITKSGTNAFHGNLFEYHRNTVTTANEWYSNFSGLQKPRLLRNLYGGSLGGPVVKKRFFFFYNYEGMREAKDEALDPAAVVPLASLGQGILRFVDTNGTTHSLTTTQINALTSGGMPVVDVNPAAVALFASAASRYPANAPGGDGLNTGGFTFNTPLPVKQNTHTARFDWDVTGNQRHMVTFGGNYQDDLFGRGRAFPDTPGTDRWSHPIRIFGSHTWVISNNITNRFSYGLTRLAYSNQGDSASNAITFRDVFAPFNFTRAFSRVNPTHNFTNDMTWIKGNHTFQFGTNIRIIRNKRTSMASAFDNGTANFGFYENSGDVLLTPLNDYLEATVGPGVFVADESIRAAQSGLAALLGRINQYTANFIFDLDGNPVNGQPTVREWATEEYDFYVQDSWKLRRNLTLNLGLRYGISRPVYETQGFQAAPNIPLDVYFQRRIQASFNGQNYTEPLKIELAGPANNAPGFYNWDKDNFQPRVSVAWSPNFGKGWAARIFGKNGASVLRGGFAMTNDYYGQQLAVSFDANNTLGFTSDFTTSANSYNITDNPAPLFSGLGMNIQSLPGVTIPTGLTFPLQQPENFERRIESSIDTGIKAPVNYSWNVTYGRELPFKMYMEASYIGRLGRNLLATRDVMMPNNLRDPGSGVTWFEAATQLELARRSGVSDGMDITFQNPFWDRFYAPGSIGATFAPFGCTVDGSNNTQAVFDLYFFCNGDNDWTFVNHLLDEFMPNRLFYQSQYGALDSFGSIANSDYHAGAFSLRQRLSNLTWDLNYTYGKSLDDTSGLQVSGAFAGAFILNPLNQRGNYGPSDFDMRHIINFNSIWDIPVGNGRAYFNNLNPVVDALLGGWQLSTIIRYNSGEPIGTNNKYFDNAGWATNWNLKSATVQIRDIDVGVFPNAGECDDGNGGIRPCPSMFANPDEAYRSFRSPLPGETGDRNKIRFPAYFVMDAGLQKTFRMPWEGHRLGFRFDVFNVTNTPIFTGIINTAMGYRPDRPSVSAPVGFGAFSTTKSEARVMQFALRYDF